VHEQDFQNYQWRKGGLLRIATTGQMAQLIMLWGLIEQVHLSNEPDQITWKWTLHGPAKYTKTNRFICPMNLAQFKHLYNGHFFIMINICFK
jgi:hypothetical protein